MYKIPTLGPRQECKCPTIKATFSLIKSYLKVIISRVSSPFMSQNMTNATCATCSPGKSSKHILYDLNTLPP